ncbi:unnamed protein product [Arabis nemorensis]|uniref:Arabidopsis retrotransposon Orf1 C-terminal domain-containing protein n=1 Tax=Arabis nemorensis TaxID=586526 RepID=A0A565AV16_9BRAS|nr:unnamed protein product [Arabis nemorensis]
MKVRKNNLERSLPLKKNDDGASSSNKKRKSKKVVPKAKVTVSPYTAYLKALQKCEMVPTKYVDKKLLAQLGILDDVEAIMNNMGLTTFFTNHKVWALKASNAAKESSEIHHTPPMLNVGGIVTPILEYCKIKLGTPLEGSSRIDACHLSNTDYLSGGVLGKFAYRFYQGPIILPNTTITSILVRDNIIFNPLIELLYEQSMELPLITLKPNKRRKTRKAQVNEDCSPPPLSIYGSKRYHLPPLDVPLHSTVERHSYRSVHLLQRWCKWQDRTIYKLCKSVKGLKRQVKELTSQVNVLTKKLHGSSYRSREALVLDSDEENELAPMETEETIQALQRNFISGESSSFDIPMEPIRPSSYERRPTNKRVSSPTPTPSPSSSNPSLQVSDSKESETF